MKKPNILWICTDQQRFDTLGCYGNHWVSTPNIDRLARIGTQFECAFSQSPVCTPSRGAFLTGRYPRTCRSRQNGANIPGTEVLVTRMFADAGYHCGLSGKHHLRACFPKYLGPGGRESRIDDGYETFHWSHGSGRMGIAENDYHTWLAEHGLSWKEGRKKVSDHVSTAMTRDTSQMAWCSDMAIEFFTANAGSPWLFSLNAFDPHAGFDPPEEFLAPYLEHIDEIPLPAYIEGELDNKPLWQMYDHINGAYGGGNIRFRHSAMAEADHKLVRAAYWAMCDQIDYHVGKMLTALEATGQIENTIVIFTSDHGELLGDHGIYMKGPFFYDCSIRVPLIICMPGAIKSQCTKGLVELLDLPQTILEAAGIDAHPGMMGKSLWPLLTGLEPSDFHRPDIYCESYNACEGHNGANEQPAYATMIRTETHKMVVAHGQGTGELYDLSVDPGEHKNLWDVPEASAIKTELLVRLADRMAFTSDPLPERVAPW